MRRSDILVIGAGPAGSVAAIACRRLGLSVTLLEAQAFPRPLPGETLPPAIEPLLQSIGASSILREAGYRRYRGIHVNWGENKAFQALGADYRGLWQGFQAVRSDFDARLLQKAVDCGVQVIQPCRARNILTQDAQVVGLNTTQGVFHCHRLLDATGRRHWLARQLSIKLIACSPKLLAQYRYIRSEAIDKQAQPQLVSTNDGWTWRAPISETHYAWMTLNFDGNPNIQASSPKCKGADVTWRYVERPAGPGYYCLGDAACVLDPLSGHGVLRAVMSAQKCASLIANEIDGSGQAERESYRKYNRWLLDWFEHDRARLASAYTILASPPSWLVATPL